MLTASLTTIAVVVWEFLECAIETATGSNMPVSLSNTRPDLVIGMAANEHQT